MRRLTVGIVVLALLGAGGYAVADAYDRVPGVLTRPEPITSNLAPLPGAAPLAPPVEAPAPDPATLQAQLTPLIDAPALGPGAGVVVRDVVADTVLWARGQDEPRALASVQKILALPVLALHLPLDARMQTKVVAGAAPGEVVLVAGGDTLLATGAGDPRRVVGHAGLADLARQVASAAPAGPLTLRLDNSYARGPRILPSWDPEDVTGGFTRTVAQIGLADLRPIEGRVPRTEGDIDVVRAFAEALRAQGRTVEVPSAADLNPAVWPTPEAQVLGAVESARYVDVIGHALAESDNALTENLVRQAMIRGRVAIPEDGSTGTFVLDGLRNAGVDAGRATLSDASGLSPGQSAPLAVVDQALGLMASGKLPGTGRLLAELPIAGVSGTLTERFHEDGATGAIGIPRLKSGTLTGVGALGGTTVTRDGRLLAYVTVANNVPPSIAGTKAARAALDRFAAALTACGCR